MAVEILGRTVNAKHRLQQTLTDIAQIVFLDIDDVADFRGYKPETQKDADIGFTTVYLIVKMVDGMHKVGHILLSDGTKFLPLVIGNDRSGGGYLVKFHNNGQL